MYVPFCIFYFHCVVLCIVCVQMCTVLLPPGVNPIAVNKYIISYQNVNGTNVTEWAWHIEILSNDWIFCWQIFRSYYHRVRCLYSTNVLDVLIQGCTNIRCQVTAANKFGTVVRNNCGHSIRNLLHVTQNVDATPSITQKLLQPSLNWVYFVLITRVSSYSYNKNQQHARFLKFILVYNSTCFGQVYCPSSGV
jgi:hypothetical protein